MSPEFQHAMHHAERTLTDTLQSLQVAPSLQSNDDNDHDDDDEDDFSIASGAVTDLQASLARADQEFGRPTQDGDHDTANASSGDRQRQERIAAALQNAQQLLEARRATHGRLEARHARIAALEPKLWHHLESGRALMLSLGSSPS
mmetsp:Transcript_10597/g.23530  ORF Transcript_10597/g.23530 Transcript_10597/m.23530 type:complete len:146 (-) Transcript_10597:56-493(-)|eukprot:CAMPEP_0168780692 /NCGR_PEP_ID=MMETSP0725-20121227/8249_1 /TAXON_ID=265536 /ORGANISM="Amphiprora sp., Strain CCMP467" /LENGTH=145 /DNA_ID=CAMNT_0008830541 /DNA_START=128 /DNA_END=565 /DNA_ORIENTATION=+